MAIRFNCPSCQRVLRVDDQFAGKRSKCPGCSNPVTVPAGANGGGNFDFATQPAGGQWMPPGPSAPARAPRNGWEQTGGDDVGGAVSASPSWGTVATGLKLFRMATTLKIVAIIGMFVGMIVAVLVMGAGVFTMIQSQTGAGGNAPPSNAAAGASVIGIILMVAVYGLFLLTVLIQYVLQIVGGFMNCAAPSESGVKGLAIGLAVCILLPIATFSVQMFDNVILQSGVLNGVAGLGGIVVMIAEWVLFVMLLYKIGAALDSRDLCSRAVNFGIWIGVYVASVFVLLCVGVGVMVLGLGAGLAAIGSANPNRPGFDDGSSQVAAQSLGMVGMIGGVVALVVLLTVLVIFFVMLAKYYATVGCAINVIRHRTARAEA